VATDVTNITVAYASAHIYLSTWLFMCGDVELNPGPTPISVLIHLDQLTNQLAKDVRELQTDMKRIKEEIGAVMSFRDEMTNKLDSLDASSRHNNLKFLGVPESDRESEWQSMQAAVDTLNYCSQNSGGGWSTKDIERAYRADEIGIIATTPDPSLSSSTDGTIRWMSCLTLNYELTYVTKGSR
jgi:hypothetical protein